MCVRGLKPACKFALCYAKLVARRVRAWIETFTSSVKSSIFFVARRVRAWIETILTKRPDRMLASHAVCVRGLKRNYLHSHRCFDESHAVCVRGLKQLQAAKNFCGKMSHAVCVRGLKQDYFDKIPKYDGSHAVCVRGLKQYPR